MADDAPPDASLDAATPTPDAAQLSLDQASDPSAATPAPPQAEPPADQAAPAPFAGKFKSAEEAYWQAQGELTALRAQLQTATTKPAASTPQYSMDQLWSLRAQKLQELTAAQVNGQPDKAATLAANVNWIDNELQQQQLGKLRNELAGQSSLDQLVSEGTELLKPYQGDLVPGNPVHDAAQRYYGLLKRAVESGQNLDQILTGMAVQMAVAKTGKAQAGAQQEARAEFAGALKQSLKQAVVTGAGKAVKPPDTAPDFTAMSDRQFDEYRRKLGVLS